MHRPALRAPRAGGSDENRATTRGAVEPARAKAADERQADELGERMAPALSRLGSLGDGPLPGEYRRVVIEHLGVDPGAISVETDSLAPLSRGALAVARWDRISLGEHADPRGPFGALTLGHELTHVAQQRASGVHAEQADVPSPAETSAIFPDTLEGARSALKQHQPVRAAEILRGQSMPVLLAWLADLRFSCSAEYPELLGVARGLGGGRLHGAASLVWLGPGLTPSGAQALSADLAPLPRDQRLSLQEFAKARGASIVTAAALFAPPEVWTAQAQFWKVNQSLGNDRLMIINQAFWTAIGELQLYPLLAHLYVYYSTRSNWMFLEKPGIAVEPLKDDRKGQTGPHGATSLDPTALTLDPASLGSILLHEFLHTRHENEGDPNVSPAEGEAYALEAVLGPAIGAPARADKATELIQTGSVTNTPVGTRWRFIKSALVIAILKDYLDTGATRARAALPALPAVVDRNTAERYLSSYIGDPPDAWPAEVKSIAAVVSAWAADLARRRVWPIDQAPYRDFKLPYFEHQQLFGGAF